MAEASRGQDDSWVGVGGRVGAVRQFDATPLVAGLRTMSIMSIFRKKPINLKSLEFLLPPSPPLAGRWELFDCQRCAHSFRLDRRVRSLPVVKNAVRLGLLRVCCPQCHCDDVRMTGLLVS